MKAPIVLVCQNNGWAISVPRSAQTASETLAQKAIAYGIPGRYVDGNDAIAMYREVKAALQRAYNGEGPTFIEAVTYRLGPHSGSDDPTRYRLPNEVTEWEDKRDPLLRLRIYLERQGYWDEQKQQALEEDTRAHVSRAVTSALTEPVPAPESMFDSLYASSSPLLDAQRQELQNYLRATEKGVNVP